MSDFWWNRLPQYWQGYGRVSLWISKCVDNVLDRLKDLPHCLHWKERNRRLVIIIIIKNVTIDCMTQQFVFNKSLNQYHFQSVHLTGLTNPFRVHLFLLLDGGVINSYVPCGEGVVLNGMTGWMKSDRDYDCVSFNCFSVEPPTGVMGPLQSLG